ncbi:MAG: ATPase [Bacteroidetes bacterium]|nr:MAG: ATPase [Bacteroidota bacterium]
MPQKRPQKIVITGPESSGKTTLSQALSEKLSAPVVPEYARLYLERFGPEYTLDDLTHIAHGQAALELATAAQTDDLLLADTSLEVIRVWWDYRFGTPPPWLEALLWRHRGDFYLLCAPDLPWQPDPLRENPHDRAQLFDRYVALLERLGLPYGVVEGSGEARTRRALAQLAAAGLIAPL